MRLHKQQKGYTLIELMVAGVLGLFLFAGALQVFLSSSKTTTLHSAISDLQERTRFINKYFGDELERAGWIDPTIDDNNPIIPDPMLPVTFAVGPEGTTRDDGPNCDDAMAPTSACDRVRINYFGIRDCLGQQVDSGNINLVTNFYYVENGDLYCESQGETDIILNDVESLQLLYGLDDSDGGGFPYTSDSDERDGIIDRYVEAYDFTANTEFATLMAIRFAILLRSNEVNAYDRDTIRSFTLFNEDTLTYTDRRLRLLVTGTSIVANAQ